MNLEPDLRSTVFEGCETFESYVKFMMPDIWFKPGVHPDVLRRFHPVKKLIEHSYFEYEFYDIATIHSMFTLEMALKIRYKEITNDTWNREIKKGELKRNLFNLLKWFNDRYYLEVYNDEFLNTLRKVRNTVAHPEGYSIGGPAMYHWIEQVVDMINDTYEDPELRKKRFEETDIISTQLKELAKNGAILRFNNNEEVIYSANISFIENKTNPPVYHFAFIPTDIDHGDNSVRKNFIPIITSSYNFNNSFSELVLKDINSNSEIILSKIDKENHKNLYENFSIEITGINLIHYYTILYFNSVKYYNKIRRNFLKK